MGSYYSTASQIRNIDSRILAALIATCGITSADDALALAGPHSFTVDTDVGELQLTFAPGDNDSLPSRGKVGLPGSVFGKFTDVALAASVLGRDAVNTYNGKWNFHFSGGYTPEVMADAIRAINPRNFKLRSRYWYPGAVDA